MDSTQRRLTRRHPTVCLVGLVAALIAAPVIAQEVTVMQRGPLDVHEVQKGDTLWDLSSNYLQEPLEWPRLWSYNPHITNPHWIYPGDLVYLRAGMDGKGQSSNPSGGPRRFAASQAKPLEIHLAMGGFIEPEEVKFVGRIAASPKEAVLLGELDTVWVGFGEKAYSVVDTDRAYAAANPKRFNKERFAIAEPEQEVKVGSLFAIVRPDGQIRDPEDGDKVLGHKYIMLGSLQITEVSDKYLNTAEIVQSWMEIERGDMLVPYDEQMRYATPAQADKNMVAQIVDMLEIRSNLGELHYVYVNKGADDGVVAGNRFFIYQRKEGLSDFGKPQQDAIPWMRIGQVMLIDVRKNYAMGLIIDSSKNVLLGDRLEMYENY